VYDGCNCSDREGIADMMMAWNKGKTDRLGIRNGAGADQL